MLMDMLNHAQKVASDPNVAASMERRALQEAATLNSMQAEEIAACEAALQLGLSFDEVEERQHSTLLEEDETEAKRLTAEEEASLAVDSASMSKMCDDDEALARRLEEELQKEYLQYDSTPPDLPSWNRTA